MAKKTEGEMSFLEHLEVMRWHLLRAFAAIIIMALVAFIFKEIVFDKIILAPKEPEFPTNRWLCRLGEILGLQRICINQNPFGLQTVKMAEQFFCTYHRFTCVGDRCGIPLYILGILEVLSASTL